MMERARSDPYFLGFLLNDYARRLGWEDEAFAEHLQCPLDRLPHLFLCRRPADTDPRFAEEVRRIAEYAPCDETQLLAVLREVVAWAKLSGNATTKANPAFLAARDRQDNQSETPNDDKPADGDEA